ncbi:DUF805 domain-containing protein [Hymenobacter pini]|uniref:DUF805 domain-containing protein n=1 Tax=Hymenobacter pini TaxID=2880879 RepID=UPI001CF31B79|nr:DUF805 domain-containing protein [Hymenobacter pini]MCA8833098.1 DUF805 domain-containing protein [Hymenobacter pini]
MKEFFLFRGRLRRRAYWGRVLGIYGVSFGLYAVLCRLVLLRSTDVDTAELLAVLLLLTATFLMIVQTVKRLHDTGLSGWWWWLLMVPWLGNAFSIGIPLVNGTSGPNRFGPDPKGRPGLVPVLPVPDRPGPPEA